MGRVANSEVRRSMVEYSVRLYQSGYSTMKISRLIGVHYQTVVRWLRERGIAVRHRATKAIKCVECGKPTDRRKRCSWHLRLHHAEQCKEAMRRWRAKNRHLGIVTMLSTTDLQMVEIAEKLGVPSSTVRNINKREKIRG